MNMAAQASNDAIHDDGRHGQSQDSDGSQKLGRRAENVLLLPVIDWLCSVL
jgi:hypothetical protein